MDLEVFFAGTAGAVPTVRRGLPATLIRRGGSRLLFDCGEGTQRQLVRSVGLADLDAVFLTHFHADHWLGLTGLLKTFDLRDRDAPLTVYGPRGLTEIVKLMRPILGRRLSYDLRFAELEPGQPVPAGDDAAIVPIAVEHRSFALGYALVEEERPGRFDPETATRLGVTPGPDFGRLQAGETVNGVAPEQVVGPPRPGRKIVLSGDTRPCEAIAVAAHQAELLVHEATLLDDEHERAVQTGHSTAREAAEVAVRAEVRALAITHLSPRYTGRQVRDEAREVFPEALVPRDFDTIEIPFPERGEPELIHWEDRKEREAAATA